MSKRKPLMIFSSEKLSLNFWIKSLNLDGNFECKGVFLEKYLRNLSWQLPVVLKNKIIINWITDLINNLALIDWERAFFVIDEIIAEENE